MHGKPSAISIGDSSRKHITIAELIALCRQNNSDRGSTLLRGDRDFNHLASFHRLKNLF